MKYRKRIESIVLDQITHVLPNEQRIFYEMGSVLPLKNVLWLRGATGSGRSLLIRMLLGIVIPTRGSVVVNGDRVSDMTFDEFLPYRLNMGLSFDFGGLLHNRNIFGNLSLQLEYHNFGTHDAIQTQVEKYLTIFNLHSVMNERPSSIVGSLRKAACVARAFVHEPQLLLLDDPTTGLRSEVRTRLARLIGEAKDKGQTVILTGDDEDFFNQFSPIVFEFKNQKLRQLSLGSAA